MNTKGTKHIVATLLCIMFTTAVHAQSTAFTYQGQLTDNGAPANGFYDLGFELFDAETDGDSLGAGTNTAIEVVNGLFAVALDFGADVFNGNDRWLEIGAVTNGGGALITLSPRQPITPAPYALYAPNAYFASYADGAASAASVSGSIAASQLTGTISSNNIGAGSITTSKLNDGAVGTDQIAEGAVGVDDLSPTVVSNTFWRLEGNSDTSGGVHFLGTTDNQPLDIRVNNTRCFRLVYPTSGEVPNLVGGYGGNSVGNGTEGAIIAGGGRDLAINSMGANTDFGMLGGGAGNSIASDAYAAIVVGGEDNSIGVSSHYSVIGGGSGNAIEDFSSRALIGGGRSNDIGGNSDYTAIGGGYNNSVSNSVLTTISGGLANSVGNNSSFGVIAGGAANTIVSNSEYAVVGGGTRHTVAGFFATVAGGSNNTTSAEFAMIGGGEGNTASGMYDTVGGGVANVAYSGPFWPNWGNTVGGGVSNQAVGNTGCTIAGGKNNKAQSGGATVGGGSENDSYGISATIGGGYGNTASGYYTFVGGGYNNRATALVATIGGGDSNTASNQYATVPGGRLNVAGGPFSFAAGNRAKANHQGSFVWADSTGSDFASTANNQFIIRASGGVAIGTNNPAGVTLYVAGSVKADSFLGGVTTSTLGTMDEQPLELRVNNVPGFRLEYPDMGDVPNVIGGYWGNDVSSVTDGAVVAGGYNNSVSSFSSYASIAGGRDNFISSHSLYASIAGGRDNSISAYASAASIAGGRGNSIDHHSSYAVIGGGFTNSIGANASYSIVGGGHNCGVADDADYAYAAGRRAKANHPGTFVWADSTDSDFASTTNNQFNVRAYGGIRLSTAGSGILLDGNPLVAGGVLQGDGSGLTSVDADQLDGIDSTAFARLDSSPTFSGTVTADADLMGDRLNVGTANSLTGTGATIAGGKNSTASSGYSVVGGGYSNTVSGGYALVSGGYKNTASGTYAVVGGGNDNMVTNIYAVVGGGRDNVAGGSTATVGGGADNVAIGSHSTVGGGYKNTVSGPDATVCGGYLNEASGYYAAVGGGDGNVVSGDYATVPGGVFNSAVGTYSLAAGRRANADHSGTFIWADSTAADFASSGNDQFLIRANGGVGINKNDPSTALDVNGTVTAAAFAGNGAALTGLPNGHALNAADGTPVNALVVDNNGKVGIGTTTPGDTLEVNGGGIEVDVPTDGLAAIRFKKNNVNNWTFFTAPWLDNDDLRIRNESGSVDVMIFDKETSSVGIRRTPTANTLEVEGNASKTAAGSWLANSDVRIKQNIQPVTGALDTLERVRLVSFEYTDAYRDAHPYVEDRAYLNVVAQEFQKVFPDYVKGSGETLSDGSEILQVDTYPLTIYSAAAIQELNRKLERENAELRQELKELRGMIEHLVGTGDVK